MALKSGTQKVKPHSVASLFAYHFWAPLSGPQILKNSRHHKKIQSRTSKNDPNQWPEQPLNLKTSNPSPPEWRKLYNPTLQAYFKIILEKTYDEPFNRNKVDIRYYKTGAKTYDKTYYKTLP